MKQLKVILTILLSVCISLSPFASINTQAASGPNKDSYVDTYINLLHISDNEEVYIETEYKKTRIYDNGAINNTITPGVSYDLKSNTLTLKNVNRADYAIFAQAMGDDFKISVVGTNKLAGIFVLTDSDGGSLTITGTGTLALNEKLLLSSANSPLSIFAESTNSVLKIASTVTLSLYTRDNCAIFIQNTSAVNNAIQIGANKPNPTNPQKLQRIVNVPYDEFNIAFSSAFDANQPSKLITNLDNYKKDGKIYGVYACYVPMDQVTKYDIYEYIDNPNSEYPFAKYIETVRNLDSYTPMAGSIAYTYYYASTGKVTFKGQQTPNIDLKSQVITTAKIKAYKAKQLKKKKISFNLNAKTSGDGKLTYKVTKYPKKMKKFISVSKAGKVTLKKKAKKGSYKITITATATNTYKKAEKTITIKVK